MQFPKSLHAEGWHKHIPHLRLNHDSDDLRSPRVRRVLVAAVAVAVAALAATAGMHAVNDPRPLDVQLGAGMYGAGSTLRQWQEQLSNGLQVSLRAVADGKEAPAAAPVPAHRPTPAAFVAQAGNTGVPLDDAPPNAGKPR